MEQKKFNQRIDFYGQALAAYVVVLVIFLVFYGTLEDGNYTLAIFSPLVILMFVIIIGTAILLLLAALKRKMIIIDDNSMILKNRFFEKKIDFNEIEKIKINKSPSKIVRDNARFVRIKIKNKKKFILVRTASFHNDRELLHCFIEIKSKLHQQLFD
jgi:hypothetical protein